MKKLITLVLGVLMGTGCATPAQAMAKKGRVAVDAVTQSTILDGDATALVEGCGQQVQVGFVYCRQVEGEAANRSVWFIGPPAQCDREACVFIKVFNNQGALAWGGSLPKGAARVEVPWKTLLASDTFQVGSRGLWSFTEQVFYKDPDGHERESTAIGDIVLRVFRKGYLPLDHVQADPSFVWEWAEAGRVYKMTSGLRAFVGVAQ